VFEPAFEKVEHPLTAARVCSAALAVSHAELNH
jgi:hypothetical protein